MTERWATFDCYGTLVDWNAGIRGQLENLFGVEQGERLLARYHELEPEIQASSPGISYREVLTVALVRLAEETGLTLPEGETSALAQSLPAWPVFGMSRPFSASWLRMRSGVSPWGACQTIVPLSRLMAEIVPYGGLMSGRPCTFSAPHSSHPASASSALGGATSAPASSPGPRVMRTGRPAVPMT